MVVHRPSIKSGAGERRATALFSSKSGDSRSGSVMGDRERDENGDGDCDGTGAIDINSKDCEQAVRTCLMLALLQSNERSRLDR